MHERRSRSSLLLAWCLSGLLPVLCSGVNEAAAPAHAPTHLGTDPFGEQLITWIRSHGGQVRPFRLAFPTRASTYVLSQ